MLDLLKQTSKKTGGANFRRYLPLSAPPRTLAGGLTKPRYWVPLGLLAALLLAAAGLFPQQTEPTFAQTDQTPPGPCEDGYIAPTPTSVPVTAVPIEVSSTTADYFVLYAKHTLSERTLSGSPIRGITSDIPVSVTRGEDGTTTLSDNLEPLSADQYRVEKYEVAQPADLDGDCVDDITELDGLGAYNPINPVRKMEPHIGAAAITSPAEFQRMAFQGESHETHLDGIAFVKFWILDTYSGNPQVFFMNTKSFVYHTAFLNKLDIKSEEVAGTATAGQLVWHPNVPAPDGTLVLQRRVN